MKKVLFFIESLSGGGAEKVLTDLVTNIDKSNFDVTVCTVSDNGIYQDEVEKNCHYYSMLKRSDYNAGGIRKVYYWLMNKFIYKASPRQVYKHFIKGKYDVEVAFVEGYATKLIANSTNHSSKKIAWVHIDVLNNSHSDRHYRDINEQIKAYNSFNKIVCVSRHVQTAFEKKFKSINNSCVIYNPVDIQKIMSKSSEPIDLEPNPDLQMVTVGRLEEQKGYIRLLKCIERIKHFGNFNLWIIGSGSQQGILEEYIKNNHLENQVKLVGFTENPYKYVKKADAFICSSYAEGFSTAATEALILEKPVFTVDCSGMKELFGEYKCGEIVDNTDRELELMLMKMVNKEYIFESYVNDIRKRIKEFSLEQQIREIEKEFL